MSSTTEGYRQIIIEADAGVPGVPAKPLVDKIRDILRLIENSLLNDDVLGVELVAKKPCSSTSKLKKRPFELPYIRSSAKFPETKKNEARRFVMIVQVLKIIYVNLSNSKMITKRDLFYQDTLLFSGKQENANALVDMLAFSFDVETYELGIIGAKKGLMYGDITIAHGNGKKTHIKKQNGATLIPLLMNNHRVEIDCTIKNIIVVEKEAIFQLLCNEHHPFSIIVTGKGYPDRATQVFMSKLSASLENIPSSRRPRIYGVADSDPHGINILMQYRFGHIANSRGRINSCKDLVYLGVHINEYFEGWLDIKASDIILAGNLLQRLCNEFEYESKNPTVSPDSSFNSPFNDSNNTIVSSYGSTASSTQNSFASSQETVVDEHIGSLQSSVETTIAFKRELQRQLFFAKKCEMNVIAEEGSSLSNKLYIDKEEGCQTGNSGSESSISKYLNRKLHAVNSRVC